MITNDSDNRYKNIIKLFFYFENYKKLLRKMMEIFLVILILFVFGIMYRCVYNIQTKTIGIIHDIPNHIIINDSTGEIKVYR